MKTDTSRHTEEVVMLVLARKIEMEHKMGERTALDEKVDHIQRDVTELKADVKRVEVKLDEKFGALDAKVDQRFGSLDAKLDEKVGALDAKMDQKIGTLDAKVDQKFGSLAAGLAEHRLETEKSFGQVRDEIGKVRLELRDAFTAFRRDRTGQIAWTIGVVIAAIGGASGLERFLAPRPTPPAHETSGERSETTQRTDNADADSAQRSGQPS
jgi:chromosome segregation ATPase